jgi:hypothetical protein
MIKKALVKMQVKDLKMKRKAKRKVVESITVRDLKAFLSELLSPR